jgi:glycosyltransferase involved in cell wall biosynthesis
LIGSLLGNLRARLRTQSWALRRLLKPLEDPFLSARDLGSKARLDFLRLRQTADYLSVFEKPDPLVSICIATYNRAELLQERSLRACLNQTYRNIEIIVVGDHCTDETEQVMSRVGDPRVQFVNLPERGQYPEDPQLRWMVAGTAAVNHALTLARGDFITHLDDDDEHGPQRTEVLLQTIVNERADLVYHPFRFETALGEWEVNPAKSFHFGAVTTSSIFYHRHFRDLHWDPRAYRYREPGDWNRLRKFGYLGAKTVRHPEPWLSHFRERNQKAA